MNSKEIFEVIERIAATSSKNEKQAIVAEYKDDEEFKAVLIAALDPLTSYGIKIRPEKITYPEGHINHRKDENFSQRTWDLINDLRARRQTGNIAIDSVGLEMGYLNLESAELFWRIISKDLRAGFSDSTVNKSIKGLIQEFPYMRCSLPKEAKLEDWNFEEGVFSQEKADGMFTNASVMADGEVILTSRQGTPLPIDKFADIANELAHIAKNMQFHGELLVLVDGKVAERSIGNGILNSVAKGGDFEPNQVPVLHLWDAIPLADIKPKGKCTTGYYYRLASLANKMNESPIDVAVRKVSIIPTKQVMSLAEAYEHCKSLMLKGKEGTILKKRSAVWTDSTSREQVKLKLEFEVDLQVTEIIPGRVGSKNEGRAGSLRCRSSCNRLIVDVAVKNEKMRDEVDAQPGEWIGKIVPATANEVLEPSESNSFHTLFLPRMTAPSYRTDKTVADSLERILAIKDMAILGKQIMAEAA